MLLEGKVAVVTGGGRGIGADISRVLAAHGAKVAAVYSVSAEKAEGLCAEIRGKGGEARAFQADVREAASVEAMVAEVLAAYGRVDGVVNNAVGGRQHAPFDDAAWQDYADMFDFGCKAVVNTVRALKPIFAEQGEGRVVNIVTELWNMGSAEWSTYLAGKGAMVGLSRALTNELGPMGIRVNMVAPGYIFTDRWEKISEETRTRRRLNCPIGMEATADDVAEAVAFLASDASRNICGERLVVDAGCSAQHMPIDVDL